MNNAIAVFSKLFWEPALKVLEEYNIFTFRLEKKEAGSRIEYIFLVRTDDIIFI